LKWESTNPEFQKIGRANEYFKKASGNVSAALTSSDQLLGEVSGEQKKRFGSQLAGFKSQVKDLNARLNKIVSGIDEHSLPRTEDVHQLLSLAIAGTGFGIEVSKKNASKKTGH